MAQLAKGVTYSTAAVHTRLQPGNMQAPPCLSSPMSVSLKGARSLRGAQTGTSSRATPGCVGSCTQAYPMNLGQGGGPWGG
jgi:hypothetical protein